MRLADVQLSFPFILLAMTINAIVGLGLRNIILSLSAAGWVVYARVVRGEVLSIRQRDYVHAAAALGVGRARLLLRHVLPNAAPSLIVVASLQFSQTYASYGNNKTVDEKIARAVRIVDEKGRAAAYADLQRLLRDEAPWVFLWQQTSTAWPRTSSGRRGPTRRSGCTRRRSSRAERRGRLR